MHRQRLCILSKKESLYRGEPAEGSIAAVQLQAGLWAQAVVSQQRALEVLPERARLEQLQTRLSDYLRCAGK